MFEISGGSGAGCVGNEPQDLPVETPLHPSHGALLGRSEDVLEAHGTRDGPQFRARGLLSTVRANFRELNSGVLHRPMGCPR